MTTEQKILIDSMSMLDMLRMWRFSSGDNALLQGETGKYFSQRMFWLRDKNPEEWIRVSKTIGW